MRLGSWLVAGVVAAGLLTACPNNNVPEEEDNNPNRLGRPCSVDSDCNGLICVGGLCADPNALDAGNGSSGMASSGSSSSGGRSSSAASGGIMDAGPTDLYQPRARITASPPGPIEFGAQRIGQSVEKTVLITNEGDAPATIVSLGFRNNMSGEFSLSVVGGSQPSSLAVGEQFTVRITHTPTDGTPDRAYLSLVTTAVNPLVEVELVAEFKGDSVMTVHRSVADTGASVTQAAMPPVAINAQGTLHLYVKNTGAVDSALTVNSITTNPPNSAVWQVRAGPLPRSISSFRGPCVDIMGCGPGATDCANELCVQGSDGGAVALEVIDIELTFTATQPGQSNIAVTINAQAGMQMIMHTVDVAALAQTGRLEASPNPLEFGEVFIGRPRTLDVRIENAGNAIAEISSFSFEFSSPAAYTVNTTGFTFPYTLTPGSYMVLQVTFNPPGLGGFNNTLLTNLVSGAPLEIQVSGIGANEPQINVPMMLDFGNVYVTSSRTLSFPIANSAAGLLRIQRAYITGAAMFTFAPTIFMDPIPLSGSVMVNVTYAPQLLTFMDDNAQLVLETNDPDALTLQVALRGRAVRPVASIIPTPTVVDFGPVLQGTSVQRTVSITNVGQGDLTVRPTNVLEVRSTMGAPLGDFTVVGNRPQVNGEWIVSQGGSDTLILTITFAPTSSTTQTGNLALTTNDLNNTAVDVVVTGGGASCPARANATVAVNGGLCVYTCVGGHHACGDTCLSNTSPDSCGSRCTPCDTRQNATAACNSGQCAYTCNNPHHDNVGLTPGSPPDLNVAQGTGSNGCEYLCPSSTPGTEICDAIDNDCDGQTDEGQPLESPEPPSVCSVSATNLGDVNDGDSAANVVTFTGYKMYPDGDSDWFRFRAHEVSSCSFASCFPWEDQTYEVKVSLEGVPAGIDWDLRVDEGGCGSGTCTSVAGSGSNERVVRRWKGDCGSEDNKDFYVQVFTYPSGSGAGSCFAYTLRVSHQKIDCDDWNSAACTN